MVARSLGHYEILGTLGSGGMGDVYVAEDVHLGRKVALKVLPDEVAADAQRRARFEREAKLLAALNHVNVATLYGFEQADDVPIIAMELVEGETLEDRLADGRCCGLREALEIARQIAEGLEAAHSKRIVHRDLKPANVMLTPTGTAKILDFGIATSLRDPTASGKVATARTTEGSVLGTPQYMSPEQIRGGVVDRRTDIWAFGCLLFELLSGRPPFARETVADTLAAIIDQEPDWDALPPATPELVRAVLRRCLNKDVDQRVHDIADARIELDEVLGRDRRRRRPPRPWWRRDRPVSIRRGLIAVAFLTALGWLAWSTGDRLFFGGRPLPGGQPYQVTTGATWASQPALSPDGSRIAYSANIDGSPDIYVVDVQGGEPVPLVQNPASDTHPAWFPDGSAVAFESDRDGSRGIWKVRQFGGGVTLLVPNAGEPDVSPDGSMIAFTRPSAAGQTRIGVASVDDPASVTIITTDEGGLWDHGAPAWSPDGHEICYASRDGLRVVAASGGEVRSLTDGGYYDVEPAWSFDGHYVYFSSARGGAQAIWRVRTSGDASPEQVTLGMGPESHPSLSHEGGTLVYATGATRRELVLRDRDSSAELLLSDLRDDLMPGFAPDAGAVVYQSRRWGLDPALWVQPLADGAPSAAPFRLAEHVGIPSHPAFSPDGQWIAYYRILGDQRDIFVIPATGGTPSRLTDDPAPDIHPDWSPDGSQLVFASERSGSSQLWTLPVRDGRALGPPRQLTHEPAGVLAPAWSPDGSLVAYIRAAGEERDVWVIPWAGDGPSQQVTWNAHAFRARWDIVPGNLLVSGRWGDPYELTLRRVTLNDGETTAIDPPVRFGPELGVFDVSPDGRWLVFSRGALEGDIWVLKSESGIY